MVPSQVHNVHNVVLCVYNWYRNAFHGVWNELSEECQFDAQEM